MSTSITVPLRACTSTSFCPAPTVSTITTSNPAASRMVTASPVASDSPPRCPRLAMERMNTPSSRKWSTSRMRSPSTAPCVNWLVGSTLTMATVVPMERRWRTSAADRVLFPAPGDPVMPMRTA